MLTSLSVTEAMRSMVRCRAAYAYARAGLKVLLVHGVGDGVCGCRKARCEHPGKHPIAEFFPHGARSATLDIELLRRAFGKHPSANVALATEGLTVIDTDGPAGDGKVRALKLPPTWAVRTKRGYHHYYLGELEGGSFKVDQIDIISGGGHYVLAPPSRHVAGPRYKWDDKHEDLASVVSRINDLRHPTPAKNRTRPVLVPEGRRNDFLFRAACLAGRLLNDAQVGHVVEVLNRHALANPLPAREVRNLIQSSGRYKAKLQNLFGEIDDTRPAPMEWLWYPYIPKFSTTILAGDPGRGKSLLTAMIAAISSSGSKWPLTGEMCSPSRVIMLSAEDSWQRQTLPRLIDAGANLSNIHFMRRFLALTDEVMDELRAEVDAFEPHLIIIDTISAYMGGARDMHRQNEVGEFMATLTEIAESSASAVLAVGHLNKQAADHPLFRIVGSIGFAASIRSALFLGSDPADRTRLALAHGKANASPLGRTMIFEKVGGGKERLPKLRPIAFSDADAEDVCRIEKGPIGRPASASTSARDFILDFLGDEPIRWDSVVSAAESRSIASEPTLNNVRSALKEEGLIEQVGSGKRAQWKIAS